MVIEVPYTKEERRKYYEEHKEQEKSNGKDYYLKNKKQIRKTQNEKLRQIYSDPTQRQVILDRNKKYRKRLKFELLSHYGDNNLPKCACCGETNILFLTIDHINNDGAKQKREIGGVRNCSGLYRWLRQNGFPEGYQVLCYNCNCGRAQNNGICPHKTGSDVNV